MKLVLHTLQSKPIGGNILPESFVVTPNVGNKEMLTSFALPSR